MIFLAILVAGLLTSGSAEKTLGKDNKHIVIDELCGYLLTVIFVPRSAGYLLAGFILFRVFDIAKPPPIKRVEGIKTGGAGVMLDDIVAAVYSNACLQLWKLLF
jgi:phosphatidylglycerophosphatase A